MYRISVSRNLGDSLAAGLLAFGYQTGAQAQMLECSKQFDHVSVEEPVTDVIRHIARLCDLNTIFRPGIEALSPVTIDFDMPADQALKKVVEENNLRTDLDNVNKTLVVYPAKSDTVTTELVTPQHMSLKAVRNALERFGMLRADRLTFDKSTGSVLLRGTSDEIAELATMIRRLDEGAQRRAELAEQRKGQQLEQAQSKYVQDRLAEVAKMEQVVETIALRFANVGETTTSFQGESVSVPGIDETLKILLDLNDDGVAQANSNLKFDLGQGSANGGGNLLASLGPLPERPQTRISIDRRTNSVIVRGDRASVAEVREIVESLDVPVPLVDIEVTIVEAEAGTAKALGVQWAIGGGGTLAAGASTGSGPAGDVSAIAADLQSTGAARTSTTVAVGGASATTSTAPTISPVTLLPLASVETAVASFIFTGGDTFVSAQLNLLASESKAQIITQPHIVTMNNVAAKITDNRTIHLRIATAEGGAGDIQSVAAGLSLNITPSVILNPDTGETLVRMSINAQNSSFSASAIGEVATQEKEIQTQVVMRDSATYVMGGMFQNRRREFEDGIPGLKDIPILGALFRDQQSDDDRTETIFFITPKVIDQSKLLTQGIGVQDYLNTQRTRLTKERDSLQTKSKLIDLSKTLQEEE